MASLFKHGPSRSGFLAFAAATLMLLHPSDGGAATPVQRAPTVSKEALAKDLIYACAFEAREAMNQDFYGSAKFRKATSDSIATAASWVASVSRTQEPRAAFVGYLNDDIKNGRDTRTQIARLCFVDRRDEQLRGARLLSSPFRE